MTSLPDNSSDGDIKQMTADPSLHVDISSFPSIRGPESANAVTSAASPASANVGVVSSSNSSEYMPHVDASPKTHVTRLKGKKSNYKGKGVQRSLDWHMVARDASESEREGKSFAAVSPV